MDTLEDQNFRGKLLMRGLFSFLSSGDAKGNLQDKSGASLDWSKAGELGNTKAYDLIKKYCE